MALTTCQDCGREVSTAAQICPGCGRPFAAATLTVQKEKNSGGASAGCAVLVVLIVGLAAWAQLDHESADGQSNQSPRQQAAETIAQTVKNNAGRWERFAKKLCVSKKLRVCKNLCAYKNLKCTEKRLARKPACLRLPGPQMEKAGYTVKSGGQLILASHLLERKLEG